ncbi:hypothetical protein GCM10020358_27400 [Amorphoplanes nipponensis]|uniref:Uncharacterized protein n=1 Tax=Actinoplanes nipponensis TaxID=135950 RepID=A0A919MRK9_9ACTN|nr:hypothetical protein [Actinoplanes nipponensis]GIE54337.1 hypothetical protein Ani05nite_78710 [Actinoplanes nipponensis]
MAEPIGTARQEAERLLATVLAMASQAGVNITPKDHGPSAGGDAGEPEPTGVDADPRGRAGGEAGASGLADMISGFVGQFLGGDPAEPGAGSRGDGPDGGARPGGDQLGFDWHTAYERLRDASVGLGGARAGGGQPGRDVNGGPGGWSTGSAECCVCPVCRAIAAVRNPTPQQAARLATGAGDFASGVASLLRAFAAVSGTTGTPNRPKPPARPTTTPDQAWSAATRTTRPAESAAPEREVREGDDPWTAATRAARPKPMKSMPMRAAAPQNPTAAEQAGARTDALPGATAEQAGDGAGARPGASRSPAGDPWAAATRAPKRPTAPRTADPAAAAGPTPAGETDRSASAGAALTQEAASAGPTTPVATRESARPPTDRAESTHPDQGGNAAAAVGRAGARTGEGEAGGNRVTGTTDVWAAATAANNDTAGDTGVADTPSVDHDVPGTAPAASAAEDRGAGPGDGARAGDPV